MPLRSGPDNDDFERDILDIIPERFDADADSRLARKSALTRVILTISLAVLAIMALGVAARHILFGEAPRDRQLSVPVIHADDKAIKVKPQDRGGMDVPNQDKLIYDRMAAKSADQQPERLLPSPEQAQMPPPADQHAAANGGVGDVMPPLAATGATAPAAPGNAPPPAMTAPSPPVAAPPPMTASKPAPPVANQTMPAPTPVKPQIAVAKPPALAAPSAAKAGGWVVQLASLDSEAEAKAEWGRLRNAHKEQLGDLSSDIVRVDLGAKGIHWRVRGGPLDEAQARLLCSELAKQSQGCIVARK